MIMMTQDYLQLFASDRRNVIITICDAQFLTTASNTFASVT